jgi:hypothetical protein
MLFKQAFGFSADFADEFGHWNPQICCRIRHIIPGMALAQSQTQHLPRRRRFEAERTRVLRRQVSRRKQARKQARSKRWIM